jgi:ATP-dependent Zn protease
MQNPETFERYANQEIVGQERALAHLQLILSRLGRVGLFDGVQGAVALAGPPACGKNFAAKLVARYLQRERLVLHMGEYAFSDDIDRLVGRHGVLEKWIEEHPDGVVIFEELQKADHSIQRAVAAIVSDGAPDDPGRYRSALFLFTFTLTDPEWYGDDFLRDYYANPLLQQGRLYEALAKAAVATEEGDAAPLFDAELLSVLSEADLALFSPLDMEALRRVTRLVLERSVRRLDAASLTRIETSDPDILSLGLLLAFSPYLNAKRVAHKLPALLTDRLALDCHDASHCRIGVGSDAKKWLREFLRREHDLRDFVKFERRFELIWRSRKSEKGRSLILSKIVERESPGREGRSPYSDRLAIRASRIGFDDVAGQVRVKRELRSIIDVLQDQKGLRHFGISLPKGLLLYGPEGVGKTMLVKAFAKEAGLPYIYLRGVDLFDEMLVREVYTRARIAAPVIVVLDGVDAKGILDGNYTQIPTGVLCDMIDAAPDAPDEFVFTLATAREKEEVPDALIRPGRIDQEVEVPELDREARRFFAEKILEKPHEEGIDIDRITRYMSGMNGYELERIAKEAALDALRRGKKLLDEETVIDRINTIKYGHRLEKKRFKHFEEDLKKSAWHEAAHAVTSLKLLPEVEIEQVTVIPRSEALGLVSYMQDALESNMSKREIEANIAVLLAGRVATVRKFGEGKGLETGAFSDLQEASLYAYSAVAQFGMDETLPNVHIETLLQHVDSTLFKERIEERVIHWIEKGTELARKIVEEEWLRIERVAERLLKEEVIEGDELKRLVGEARR